MISLLIIADDFTGALDTGVQFAADGAATRVVTDRNYDFKHMDPAVQVLVIDAETRHLKKEEAYGIVGGITERAGEAGVPYIYKKTDSAMRGNVGSELAAVLRSSGEKKLSFFPAFPRIRRFTRNGILYIDGCPAEKSVFGKDPFEPVITSDVCQLIRQQSGMKVSAYSLNNFTKAEEDPAEIIVWDTETDEQLMELGKRLKQQNKLRITAGCAGFAAVLSRLLGFDVRRTKKTICQELPPELLVLCGSMNPITAKQLDDAENAGYDRERLTQSQKENPDFWNSREGEFILGNWKLRLEQSGCLMIDGNAFGMTGNSWGDGNFCAADEMHSRILKSFGQILKKMIDRGFDGTLMVTGGDTLMGCMGQLGVNEMEPLCELDPGIVLSRFTYRGKIYQVISKSGGFGSKNLLTQLAGKIVG